MDALTIDTTIESGRAVLRVGGELDAATAGMLGDAIRSASGESTTEVVIDFGALEFIDSSGLSVLVAAHKRLGKAGAGLRIQGASPAVTRVFAIAGLDQVLTITE